MGKVCLGPGRAGPDCCMTMDNWLLDPFCAASNEPHPAYTGPLKGNTRLLMGWTCRVPATVRARLEPCLPAGLPSGRVCSENHSLQCGWLQPASIQGIKLSIVLGLQHPSPPQSSRCVHYRGFGLNVPFVANLRVLRWVCLLCGSPGLNKYIKATYAA